MTTRAYTGQWAWVNAIPVLMPSCRAILNNLRTAVGMSVARGWPGGITSSATIYGELEELARNPHTTYAELAYWLVDRKHWLRYIHQQELADDATATAAAIKAETDRLLSLVRDQLSRPEQSSYLAVAPSRGVPGILWSRPATRHTEQHTLIGAHRTNWRFIVTLNDYLRAVGVDVGSPTFLLRNNIWNGYVRPVEVTVAQPLPTLVAAPPAFPYRPSAKTY